VKLVKNSAAHVKITRTHRV